MIAVRARNQAAIIWRFSFWSALRLLPHQNQAESATDKESRAATLFA